ncbi:MAG: tryptophan synthase subunit alpha [Ruminococcus sp.]|nr:tryptophan synthase subunit alpha [Ruminococcus sp.]
MKNRIDSCFENLKAKNEKALIAFVTSGDPDLETTEKCVLEMFEKGVDIIELGVPFSDPIAEGPTIQKASLRSLNGGTTLDKIFDMVKSLRQKTDKPLLLMMYINTIFKYGTEKFFSNCKELSIDGVIVPDMPFEERDEIQATADKYGIYNINLVAPTSSNRVEMIASQSNGFLYVVSSLGVTGTRSEITTDFDKLLAPLKNNSTVPYCIGFGISSPQLAKSIASHCDGVIIGSAIVNIIAEYGRECSKPVGKFVQSLKDALSEL